MTGTPVVAFDTGIASELISKEYGYLATIGDSVDLASGIHFVLSKSDDEYQYMSQNCRQLALDKFEKSKVMGKLIDELSLDGASG